MSSDSKCLIFEVFNARFEKHLWYLGVIKNDYVRVHHCIHPTPEHLFLLHVVVKIEIMRQTFNSMAAFQIIRSMNLSFIIMLLFKYAFEKLIF